MSRANDRAEVITLMERNARRATEPSLQIAIAISSDDAGGAGNRARVSDGHRVVMIDKIEF